MLVGARFACGYCLRRGVQPVCSACGEEAIDLGADEGQAFLAAAFSDAAIEPRRRRGFRGWWRGLPLPSKLEWVGTAAVAVAATAAILGDARRAGDLVWAVPYLLIVAGVAATLFHVLGLVLRVAASLGLLAAAALLGVASIGRSQRTPKRLLQLAHVVLGEKGPRRLGLRTWRHRWTVRPSPLPRSAPSLEGTVAAREVRVTVVRGRSGDMELADAALEPFEVLSDGGQRVRVEIEAGAIAIDRSLPRGAATRPALPPWLERAAADDVEQRSIPVGTRIELAGGERAVVADEDASGGFRDAPRRRVLRGTSASPLTARFG